MKKWLVMSVMLWLALFGGCGKQEPDGEVWMPQSSATETREPAFGEAEGSTSIEQETKEHVDADDLELSATVIERNTNCLVQIQADTRSGSGVLWKKQKDVWTFVTAAHVVEEAINTEIYLVEEDEKYSAKAFMVDGLDLAFVQIDATDMEEQVVVNYEACISNTLLEEVEDSVSATQSVLNGENANHSNFLEAGTQISVEGYTAAGEIKSYSGTVLDAWIYVEDFENYMMVCQAEADPGMSGGGVFRENGDLLGIVCGENEAGQLAVLPTPVIETEYELFIKN